MPDVPRADAGGLVPGYEIGAAIGKGGFATVYRARQVSLDRDVAVKIDQRVLDDDRNARRFLREATASALISSHPHVVSLIDAGTTRDNRPYLVMELCDNGSVAQLVRRNGPMPAPDVVELGIAISSALAAAHERGILHRDIKPSNILIDPYGTPRLGDFGLAALSSKDDEMSVTLEALTPAYAAPEAFEQAAPSKRADVWAFGATLYSLLTGIAPRHGDDGSPQTVAEIVQSLYQPLPPVQLPGADALMSLIWKATAPQREQRFADGPDLHAAMLELRGRFGRPHNVLAGGEVTRMKPGELAPVPQKQHFRPAPMATPTSQRPAALRPVGAPGSPPPGPARPRRAWPVVVTSVLGAALVGGGAIALSQAVGGTQSADQQVGVNSARPTATPTVGSTTAPTDVAAQPAEVSPSATPDFRTMDYSLCYEDAVITPGMDHPEQVSCLAEHSWEAFAMGFMSEGLQEQDEESVLADPTVAAACSPESLAGYTDRPIDGFEIGVLTPESDDFDAGSRIFYCLAGNGPTSESISKG